jgi:DNA-binding response OmpR family regulator
MAHKVLIADDDRTHLLALQIRLRSEGFEVICAQDAYFAVQQACEGKPDAMVLDINMPAGDGFTVQERIGRMADLEGIPVIYLTGENSQRVTDLARTHGAFALLFKPFDIADLLTKLREAIDANESIKAA